MVHIWLHSLCTLHLCNRETKKQFLFNITRFHSIYNSCCEPAAYCDVSLDIQSGKMSFLALPSFAFEDLLKATLFQSISVQVPSIGLGEGSAHGGLCILDGNYASHSFVEAVFRSVCRGEDTSETIKRLSVMISNEIPLWTVWRTLGCSSRNLSHTVNRCQMLNHTFQTIQNRQTYTDVRHVVCVICTEKNAPLLWRRTKMEFQHSCCLFRTNYSLTVYNPVHSLKSRWHGPSQTGFMSRHGLWLQEKTTLGRLQITAPYFHDTSWFRR